jgi:hypothetical protein
MIFGAIIGGKFLALGRACLRILSMNLAFSLLLLLLGQEGVSLTLDLLATPCTYQILSLLQQPEFEGSSPC